MKLFKLNEMSVYDRIRYVQDNVVIVPYLNKRGENEIAYIIINSSLELMYITSRLSEVGYYQVKALLGNNDHHNLYTYEPNDGKEGLVTYDEIFNEEFIGIMKCCEDEFPIKSNPTNEVYNPLHNKPIGILYQFEFTDDQIKEGEELFKHIEYMIGSVEEQYKKRYPDKKVNVIIPAAYTKNKDSDIYAIKLIFNGSGEVIDDLADVILERLRTRYNVIRELVDSIVHVRIFTAGKPDDWEVFTIKDPYRFIKVIEMFDNLDGIDRFITDANSFYDFIAESEEVMEKVIQQMVEIVGDSNDKYNPLYNGQYPAMYFLPNVNKNVTPEELANQFKTYMEDIYHITPEIDQEFKVYVPKKIPGTIFFTPGHPECEKLYDTVKLFTELYISETNKAN